MIQNKIMSNTDKNNVKNVIQNAKKIRKNLYRNK